jgi:dTDP-4-amino-4,6-dideoxygalactose transaminase
MDQLRAAILRPQLRTLDQRQQAWNARYRAVEDGLRNVPGLRLIERPDEESFVGSSIQWLLPGWPPDAIAPLVAACAARGVEIKWFGASEPAGVTSTYRHRRYADADPMPETDRVLAGLLDMRLPLTFSIDDCRLIACIIADETAKAWHRADPAA